MNKSTTIVGIIAVVAIVALGWWAIGRNPSPVSDVPVASTIPTSSTTQPPVSVRQAGAPMAITNQNAATTDTTVVLTGTVNPNGALTSYWYDYGRSASLGSKSKSQMVGSGFAAIPAPVYITGLVKDTTYYFRLNAQNQFGTVSGAPYSFRTTVGFLPPVGSAPKAVTLAVSDVARTTANLHGEVTPNKAVTQYWFEYGRTAELGYTTVFVAAGDGNANVPAAAALSGLDPTTTYYFRLNAQNQFGTVNGTILNFKTSGPSVPPAPTAPTATTLKVNTVGTSTATVRGTVNPGGAETKYWFEYSRDSLTDQSTLKTTSQTAVGSGLVAVPASADISGLTPRTTYHYRLVTKNSLGIVRGENASFKTK